MWGWWWGGETLWLVASTTIRKESIRECLIKHLKETATIAGFHGFIIPILLNLRYFINRRGENPGRLKRRELEEGEGGRWKGTEIKERGKN